MTGRHDCRWSWNTSHPSASVQWSPMTKYNFLWISNHVFLTILRNIFKFATFYPLYGPYYSPLDNRFNMKCNGNILKMVTQKVPWNIFCKYTNLNFWLFSGQKIMVRGDPSYKNTKPCYLMISLYFFNKVKLYFFMGDHCRLADGCDVFHDHLQSCLPVMSERVKFLWSKFTPKCVFSAHVWAPIMLIRHWLVYVEWSLRRGYYVRNVA